MMLNGDCFGTTNTTTTTTTTSVCVGRVRWCSRATAQIQTSNTKVYWQRLRYVPEQILGRIVEAEIL